MLLQNQGCGDVNEAMTNWTINVNENKPAIVETPLLPVCELLIYHECAFPLKSANNSSFIAFQTDIPTVKVLHLTDIHPDLHYAEGSLTDCGKPMCCRVGDTWEEPWNETVEAGRWGDYNCDIPLHALQDVFTNAATQVFR